MVYPTPNVYEKISLDPYVIKLLELTNWWLITQVVFFYELLIQFFKIY